MTVAVSKTQAEAAASLRCTHPHAPALDVLDIVFCGSCGALFDKEAPWVAPWAPLWQIVAAAFDQGMTPEEWATLSRPPADPTLQTALHGIWRSEVLEAFPSRYGLQPV